MKKFGKGYSSGAYTGAQHDKDDIEVQDDLPTLGNTKLGFCQICYRTDDYIGIALGILLSDGTRWLVCNGCKDRYHLLCLGLEMEDLDDGDWLCEKR